MRLKSADSWRMCHWRNHTNFLRSSWIQTFQKLQVLTHLCCQLSHTCLHTKSLSKQTTPNIQIEPTTQLFTWIAISNKSQWSPKQHYNIITKDNKDNPLPINFSQPQAWFDTLLHFKANWTHKIKSENLTIKLVINQDHHKQYKFPTDQWTNATWTSATL